MVVVGQLAEASASSFHVTPKCPRTEQKLTLISLTEAFDCWIKDALVTSKIWVTYVLAI